jgi:hypothetical protein
MNAKLVQLDPPGPYVLPEAVGFQGLVLVQGQRPTQMRFALADGSILHLPIAEHAFDKVLRQFASLYEAREKEKK